MKLPNIFEKEVTPLSLSAGTVIFAEGQKRDSMYVVKSGTVDLNVRGKNVEVVGTDGFFGEMALVDQAPRSATAIARTDCIVIPISERHFLFMVEETPFFALTVLRTFDCAPAANGSITAIRRRLGSGTERPRCEKLLANPSRTNYPRRKRNST
jgi:CRP/FNR family transcriptional regulator, cyclic AMP receptor protein